MRGGRVIEWRDSAGSPATVGDATLMPVARSFIVRWPAGGAVWSGPTAIIVEREGMTDRLPIVDVNRRILWGLRLGALAIIATSMARCRRRKSSNG